MLKFSYLCLHLSIYLQVHKNNHIYHINHLFIHHIFEFEKKNNIE